MSAESERLLEVAVHLSNAPPTGWAELFTSCSNISVPVNLAGGVRVQELADAPYAHPELDR